MLRSVKKLFADKLGASDGEIGHVNDVYFDDQNWAVRYLVADTSSWMPGRLVLISPHAFRGLYQGGKVLLVNLTRQQIENSPSKELHKPVSRQRNNREPFDPSATTLVGRKLESEKKMFLRERMPVVTKKVSGRS